MSPALERAKSGRSIPLAVRVCKFSAFVSQAKKQASLIDKLQFALRATRTIGTKERSIARLKTFVDAAKNVSAQCVWFHTRQ